MKFFDFFDTLLGARSMVCVRSEHLALSQVHNCHFLHSLLPFPSLDYVFVSFEVK